MGYRFVEEGLHSPVSTRQLTTRAEPALRAAVGLDSGRRARVERLLAERLRDPHLGEEQRTDLALTGVMLGDLTPSTAARVVQDLTQALPRANDVYTLSALAQALSAVAGRLGPGEAGRLCPRAAAELTRALARANDASAQSALVQALSAVAGRLGAKEAAQVAQDLTQALAKEADLNPTRLRALAEALSAVAGRLGPGEARRLCSRAAAELTRALARATSSPYHQQQLAHALSALAGHLGAKEAAEIAEALTRVLVEEATINPYAPGALAQALSGLAGRLGPQEASRFCSRAAAHLTRTLVKTTHLAPGQISLYQARPQLAQALSAVAGHLGAKEAAQVAQDLTQALARADDWSTLSVLAGALPALLGRLGPEEASRLCSRAAAHLTQGLLKERNVNAQAELLQALSAVAGRLGAKEAAQVAQDLTRALGKEANLDPHPPGALAQALSALAGRLAPGEAAQIAEALTVSLTKESNPSTTRRLAVALSGVAGRLGPGEASRVCSRATAHLTRALARTTDVSTRSALLQALSAVARYLGPRQAAQVAQDLTRALAKETHLGIKYELAVALSAVAGRLGSEDAPQAARALTRALLEEPNPKNAQSHLAQALSAVAGQLEPGESARVCARAAATLAHDMAKQDQYPRYSGSLPQRLAELLSSVDRPELSRRAAAVTAAAGSLPGTGHPLATPAVLSPALTPLPCRLSTQQLVEMLKQPTCIGRARRVILDQLENRYRRRFADHWAFVSFAQERKLGLDFTSPPKRLAPPAGGAGK